jgi:hypothetical protein
VASALSQPSAMAGYGANSVALHIVFNWFGF